MSLVSITAEDVHEYHGPLVPVTARLFANEDFRTSEGVNIARGNPNNGSSGFYQDFAASMNGDMIRISSGSAYSTTDALVNASATYTLIVYDVNGTKIKTVFTNISIPPGSPTTWATLQILSQARKFAYSPRFSDDNAIIALLSQYSSTALKSANGILGVTELDTDPTDLAHPKAVGVNSPLVTGKANVATLGRTELDTAPVDANHPIAVGTNSALLVVPKASDSVLGKTKLDVAPADPANPIAVGANSPLLVTTTVKLSSYADLPAAITAIGAANKTLKIDANHTTTLDNDIPVNIRVEIADGAVLSVNAGKTVTIRNLAPHPPRQIFAGLGTVAIKNAVELEMCWFTGTDPTADHTSGINAWVRSATAVIGTTVRLPDFRLRTSGNHSFPNFCTMRGGGYDPDALTGPGFLLTNAAATHVFKFVPYVKSVTLIGFSINVNASTSGTCKAIWLEGGDTAGAVMVKCEVAVIASGAVAGTHCFHYSNTGTNFYAEIVDLRRCWFSAPVNTTAVYLANYNCSVSVHETIFALSVGATAVQYSTIGILHIWRCAFNGPPMLATPHIEAVLETITGSITTGTAILTASRAFTTKDLGMRMVIAGKLDGYIKAVDSSGKATMSVNATGTAAAEALTVYRYQSTKWAGGAEGCVKGTNAFVEVTIAECQDEGVNYFFQQDTDWYDGVINFRENVVQSFVKISGDCTINSFGNRYYSLFLEDSGINLIEFNSFGDSVRPLILWNGNWVNRTLSEPRIQGNVSGATLVPVDLNNNIQTAKFGIHKPLEITVPAELAGIHDATKPMFGIGTYGTDPKPLFRAGVTDGPTNEWKHFTELQRDPANGEMGYSYTSPGFPEYRSYAFKDGPVRFTGPPIFTPTRPPNLTASQSDYGAGDTNGGGGTVILTSSGGTWAISGWGKNTIQAVDGVTRIVKNGNALGGNSITFTHEDGSSAPANRFLTSTAATITLAPSQMLIMVYDATIASWSLAKLG